MKETLRHILNPLHIYCRLKSCGLQHHTAHRICCAYERLYARIL
jgi:hypothetical protein